MPYDPKAHVKAQKKRAKSWRCSRSGDDQITGGVVQKSKRFAVGGYCRQCDSHNVNVILSNKHQDAGLWCLRWKNEMRHSLWVHVDDEGECSKIGGGYENWIGQMFQEFKEHMQIRHQGMKAKQIRIGNEN